MDSAVPSAILYAKTLEVICCVFKGARSAARKLSYFARPVIGRGGTLATMSLVKAPARAVKFFVSIARP